MNVKEAATEFGLYARVGDWRLGYLAAACVEKGKGEGGGGTDGSHRRKHDGEKVSGRAFAQMSGTSADRVLRHLDAWEKAAKDGIVKPAAELSLNSRYTLPSDLPDWKKYYKAVSGGYNGGLTRQPTPKQATEMMAQIPPKDAATVITTTLQAADLIKAFAADKDLSKALHNADTEVTKAESKRKKRKKQKAPTMIDATKAQVEIATHFGDAWALAQEWGQEQYFLDKCEEYSERASERIEEGTPADVVREAEDILAEN